MSESTSIEWTDATWNPVTGCTKVSPGCDHCYAERISDRSRRGPFEHVQLHSERLKQPLQWRTPRMIVTCSMGDLFHSKVPWNFIGQVFDVMVEAKHHTFQVLTKRPGRMAFWAEHMAAVCREKGLPWQWPPNVWAGTSVESQKYAPRLDCLARVPAKVRFVSYEPALGPVDLRKWLTNPHECNCSVTGGIHSASCLEDIPLSWLIAGGESGLGARPAHPDWFRQVRDQCQAAGIPYFFKQWGHWAPFVDNGPLPQNCNYVSRSGLVRIGDAEDDNDACMGRVGKKAAGALLDGREWREMPV